MTRWHPDQGGDVIRDDTGGLICQFWTRPAPEQIALMAAAPELAEALADARATLAVLIEPGSRRTVSSAHLWANAVAAETRARAALAKVTA